MCVCVDYVVYYSFARTCFGTAAILRELALILLKHTAVK